MGSCLPHMNRKSDVLRHSLLAARHVSQVRSAWCLRNYIDGLTEIHLIFLHQIMSFQWFCVSFQSPKTLLVTNTQCNCFTVLNAKQHGHFTSPRGRHWEQPPATKHILHTNAFKNSCWASGDPNTNTKRPFTIPAEKQVSSISARCQSNIDYLGRKPTRSLNAAGPPNPEEHERFN